MDLLEATWLIISLIVIGLAYFSAVTFTLGLVWRLWKYFRTPAPLPVVLTPAPENDTGVLFRLLGDATIFPSLFKADRWLWLGAIVMHFSLAAVLFRHLRYFTYPVPALVLSMETVALLFGYLFGIAILYLFWRRLGLKRTLYISNIPDYFALALLGGIAASGILMSYWMKVYLVDVKAFTLGLLTFQPVAPPRHPLFLIHFLFVTALMLYFPFSKLLHAGGIFFSPTRNQPYQIQQVGKRYHPAPGKE